MNPITAVGSVITTFFHYLFNPMDLKNDLLDPKIQAVYHVSSVMTSVSLFTASLAYPEWARALAVSTKAFGAASWEWITDGPGGTAVRAVAEVVIEALKGTV